MAFETEERIKRLGLIYNQAFRRAFEYFRLGTTDSPVHDVVVLELARKAEVSEDSYVLEVCSGSGGVSRLLAKNLGCRILGIDLVDYQLDVARQKATEDKLESRIRYDKGDAAVYPYPDETFDVAVDVFAWVHIADWDALIQKISRTLKPGGRLMMYDAFVTLKTTEETDTAVREKWFDPGIRTLTDLRKILRKNGFKVIHKRDRRKQVLTNWRLGLERFKENAKPFSVAFGEDVYHLFLETIEWTIDAHEREELGATLLVARKKS